MGTKRFSKKNLRNIKSGFYQRLEAETPNIVIKRRSPFKLLVAAVAVMAMSVLIFAATNPSDLVRAFFGDGARDVGFAMDMSFEQDGLKVTLVSAAVDNRKAYVFLTIQDLVADRLNENTKYGDIEIDFDQIDYGFRRLFSGYVLLESVETISYDSKTKTISAVAIARADHEFKVGDKLVFDMRGLFINGLYKDRQKVDIDLYELVKNNQDVKTQIQNEIVLLENDKMNIKPFADFPQAINNLGFVDGKFHVRTKGVGTNIVSLYDESFELEIPSRSSEGGLGRSGFGNAGYMEYIYDIADMQELKDAQLYASYMSATERIKLDHPLKFKISELAQEKSMQIDVSGLNDNIKKAEITVSPFGVTIDTSIKHIVIPGILRPIQRIFNWYNENEDAETAAIFEAVESYSFSESAYIKLIDDTKIPIKSSGGSMDYETAKGYFTYSCQYFDISKLKSVVINDKEYIFTP